MDGCLICGQKHYGSCNPNHPEHHPLSAEQWEERQQYSRRLAAEALADPEAFADPTPAEAEDRAREWAGLPPTPEAIRRHLAAPDPDLDPPRRYDLETPGPTEAAGGSFQQFHSKSDAEREARAQPAPAATLSPAPLDGVGPDEERSAADRERPMDKETLDTILAQHQTWVATKGQDGRQADLQGADLRGVDLQGLDLSGADLQRANLTGANLTDTKLRAALLSEASLERASLVRADLTMANVQGANLTGANLQDSSNLQSVTLEPDELVGADFQKANLEGANLTGAFLPAAQLQEANLKDADFRTAQLQEANLRGAVAHGADFREADMWRANLQDVDLRRSNLAHATLEGANLNGAELAGADFHKANVLDANLPPRPLDPATAEFSPSSSRWETIKATAGEWVGRVSARLSPGRTDEIEPPAPRRYDLETPGPTEAAAGSFQVVSTPAEAERALARLAAEQEYRIDPPAPQEITRRILTREGAATPGDTIEAARGWWVTVTEVEPARTPPENQREIRVYGSRGAADERWQDAICRPATLPEIVAAQRAEREQSAPDLETPGPTEAAAGSFQQFHSKSEAVRAARLLPPSQDYYLDRVHDANGPTDSYVMTTFPAPATIAHDPSVEKKIDALEDPAERAKARKLLEVIRSEVADQERPRERERERSQDLELER